uniref:Uncharacterized protein n=1 Tax=Arundo donax TaxID=35708 RepID=A0A0A9GPW9_ARUDO
MLHYLGDQMHFPIIINLSYSNIFFM